MKLVAIVLISMFVCGLALAEPTGGVVYKDTNFLTHILGPSLEHDHQYTLEKRRPQFSFGEELDIIIYRDELFGIPYWLGSQGEYVNTTGDWGIRIKGEIDFSPLTDKLLGR